MRKVERFKTNIAIDEYIVFSDENRVGERVEYEEEDWIEVKPKYYIDKSDEMIYEIWYDRTGIILDRGLNAYIKNNKISTGWDIKRLTEIDKESAMNRYKNRLSREDWEQGMINVDLKSIGYNNKDLMQRDKPKYKNELQAKKQKNNGGSSDWYLLPNNAKTLQDLIEHRNMNGAVKDMFKACYRLGIKTEDELRDLNKTAYYALREIGRVSGRKDYITIATELIGSQAIEDYCTCEECNGKCNGDCMI